MGPLSNKKNTTLVNISVIFNHNWCWYCNYLLDI